MIKLFVFRLFCYRTLSSPHQRSFAPFFCFFFRFLFFRFCLLNFVCSGFSVAFVVCLCVACRTCLPLLRPAAASQAVYLLPEHSSPNLTYLFIRFDLSFFLLLCALHSLDSYAKWSGVKWSAAMWHAVTWCGMVCGGSTTRLRLTQFGCCATKCSQSLGLPCVSAANPLPTSTLNPQCSALVALLLFLWSARQVNLLASRTRCVSIMKMKTSWPDPTTPLPTKTTNGAWY